MRFFFDFRSLRNVIILKWINFIPHFRAWNQVLLIAGHPVCACVHARLGAQCRDSFAFLILRALARAHTRTPPILPHTCDLLPTASSSTCSHSSWFSSYCGVSLPAAGTRTHPMSGATDTDNRGSPLLCATLLIRVPRDVAAKLRSSRLERDFRFMGVAPSWYPMLYTIYEVFENSPLQLQRSNLFFI